MNLSVPATSSSALSSTLPPPRTGPIVGGTTAGAVQPYAVAPSRFSQAQRHQLPPPSDTRSSLGERVFRKHAQAIQSSTTRNDSKSNPIRKVSMSRLPPAMQAQYLGIHGSDFPPSQASTSRASNLRSSRNGSSISVDDIPGKPPPGPPPEHAPSSRYNTRPASTRVKTLSKRLSERPLAGSSAKRHKTLAKVSLMLV